MYAVTTRRVSMGPHTRTFDSCSVYKQLERTRLEHQEVLLLTISFATTYSLEKGGALEYL